jgi:hypothetical protein
MDRWNHLVADRAVKLVEQPHAVLGAAMAGGERTAGDAVARVELDPAAGDQLAAGVHQPVPLDLLLVPAGRGEHEDRSTEVAPSRHAEVLLHAIGEPPLGHFHRRSSGRADCPILP